MYVTFSIARNFNTVILLILRNDGRKLSVAKSDNLQYNMVGQWDDGIVPPPPDAPMFILIDWE